jgi:hypothetical protein
MGSFDDLFTPDYQEKCRILEKNKNDIFEK